MLPFPVPRDRPVHRHPGYWVGSVSNRCGKLLRCPWIDRRAGRRHIDRCRAKIVDLHLAQLGALDQAGGGEVQAVLEVPSAGAVQRGRSGGSGIDRC